MSDKFPKAALACSAALAGFLLQEGAQARTLNGSSATVNSGDPIESWTLLNGATLDVNAQTSSVSVQSGSTLNLNADSSVLSRGSAVSLNQGDAKIAGARIESTGGFGLVLTTDFAGTPGTTANVVNSTIIGSGRGVSASTGELSLSNAIVQGNDAGGAGSFLGGGVGVALFNSSATITNGSRVTGGQNGILISPDSVTPNLPSSVLIDNATIAGATGSAIIVGSFDDALPSTATITIQNGSSLSGGNGVILETANNSTATFIVDSSSLTGDVLVNAGSTGALTLQNSAALAGNVTNVGNLEVNGRSSVTGNISQIDTFSVETGSSVSGNVSDVQRLNLSGGSQLSGNLLRVQSLSLEDSIWTTSDGQGVSNLTMNAGTVNVGANAGTFQTLNLSTLSGNGRFIMDTDLASQQGDQINVSGVATGSYDLQIRNTGVDPVKGGPDQQVVHTGTGSTAGFAVIGGQVDFGTFAYELEQRGNGEGTDWYLVQKFDDEGEPIPTPGTRSVIGLFSAAPTVWYGELTSLRSRMGELRYGKTEGGVWSRAYGNKYNLSAAGGTAYQQNQQGISFGVDAPLPVTEGQWLVGILAGYSRSDLNIAAGTSGQVDSYYLGAYTTWLSDSGYYIDAIIKANRFKNTSDVRMSDGGKSEGNYNTSGLGMSVEAGKHIKLQDDWFVEPFVQASTLWVKGQDYSLDNGMEARSNNADSFLGKVGTTVGRNYPLDKGGYVQPYVKIAMAHEFAKTNRIKVNDNTFSNDLSGSRGELGAGIAAQLTDVLQLHADVEYSNGQNIEQPWGMNVGLRYSW